MVDREGGLWVCCWETGRLLRFDDAGNQTHGLTSPYPHIVSVGFEPADPTSLLVSTGGNAAAQDAGAVLRLNVAVPGLPEHPSALAMLEHVA